MECCQDGSYNSVKTSYGICGVSQPCMLQSWSSLLNQSSATSPLLKFQIIFLWLPRRRFHLIPDFLTRPAINKPSLLSSTHIIPVIAMNRQFPYTPGYLPTLPSKTNFSLFVSKVIIYSPIPDHYGKIKISSLSFHLSWTKISIPQRQFIREWHPLILT